MMRNDHIINLLEDDRLGALGAEDVSRIESHVTDCPECLKAYTASRVAGAMLKARASEDFEPSPFFNARVMAALKAKRNEVEMPAILRLWKAAWALASAMALIVVALSSFTLFGADPQQSFEPDSSADAVELSILVSGNSAESLIFEEDAALAGDEVSNLQAIEEVFDAEDSNGSY